VIKKINQFAHFGKERNWKDTITIFQEDKKHYLIAIHAINNKPIRITAITISKVAINIGYFFNCFFKKFFKYKSKTIPKINANRTDKISFQAIINPCFNQ
jgi:hypothetical protein